MHLPALPPNNSKIKGGSSKQNRFEQGGDRKCVGRRCMSPCTAHFGLRKRFGPTCTHWFVAPSNNTSIDNNLIRERNSDSYFLANHKYHSKKTGGYSTACHRDPTTYKRCLRGCLPIVRTVSSYVIFIVDRINPGQQQHRGISYTILLNHENIYTNRKIERDDTGLGVLVSAASSEDSLLIISIILKELKNQGALAK